MNSGKRGQATNEKDRLFQERLVSDDMSEGMLQAEGLR